MPKKVEQSKDDVLGVAVTLERKELIRAIAKKEERSLSFLGGKLLERGLAAYLRDGQLNEPVSSPGLESSRQSNAVERRLPEVTDVNKGEYGLRHGEPDLYGDPDLANRPVADDAPRAEGKPNVERARDKQTRKAG